MGGLHAADGSPSSKRVEKRAGDNATAKILHVDPPLHGMGGGGGPDPLDTPPIGSKCHETSVAQFGSENLLWKCW